VIKDLIFDLLNKMVLNEHQDYIDHDDIIQLNDMQDYKKMMKIFLNNQFDEDFLIFDF
jgi:hypothetical protein